MGWKNIKQTYCQEFDVYVDRKEKDINIYLFGQRVIWINTIKFEVSINSSFKSSNVVKSLYYKLDNAKNRGELKRLYDEPDTFMKDLPVYTVRDNKVVQEFCEEYGYNKPAHSGERMSNMYFKDRDEAKMFLKANITNDLWDAYNYSFRDNFAKAFKGTRKLVKTAWLWVKVRLS